MRIFTVPYVNFTVDGLPVPKARARTLKTGRSYTPQKTKDYEDNIRHIALNEYCLTETIECRKRMVQLKPITISCAILISIYLPVPKSFNKRMTELCLSGSERPKSKPDLDNVAKAILDALNGVVYKDDSQICELFVKKMYCTKPRVEVFVWI